MQQILLIKDTDTENALLVGWLEELGLKLTSSKVEVEVEAELGNNAEVAEQQQVK